MSENLRLSANLVPRSPAPAERQNLLDVFSEQPDNPAIWRTAYSWVRAEGDGTQVDNVASDIPAEELIVIADAVRAADPAARYGLMTQPASNEKLWFDVIEGFGTAPVRLTLAKTVASGVEQWQELYHSALDLGTGTGNGLGMLEKNASYVTGVDRNAALLEAAKQKSTDTTSLVQADVTKLPFDDASFDLVTSLGIESSLDRQGRTEFYKELGRVMMPGATYLSAYYNYPHLPSAEMDKITQTSKAMLADMICDTVSGGDSITDRLDAADEDRLMTELGFDAQHYLEISEDRANQMVIRVVTKL